MKGFTLVETLVAISVLTISLVGPFYAIQIATRTAFLTRDQMIASSLAQEGVEYIRSLRDDNYLAGRTWLYGLDTCLPGPCTVDPTQVPADISSSITPLYLSSTNIYNQQNAGVKSLFTRSVTISQLNAREAKIVVTVTWERHGTQTVQVTDIIQDWL
ncbi:prepilin-type N-terminal cleavage/methylation domain-containing protein [Patescibacteria group bacterium]|nr:prepilin-type N-terminal cleavage/methylation domain-containing protein [Patescibacteria group bacterium]MBU1754896.1 prepilin-type N-terminal cleavage/methylation domain-containing protein [Patescibacteria group bacterium]